MDNFITRRNPKGVRGLQCPVTRGVFNKKSVSVLESGLEVTECKMCHVCAHACVLKWNILLTTFSRSRSIKSTISTSCLSCIQAIRSYQHTTHLSIFSYFNHKYVFTVTFTYNINSIYIRSGQSGKFYTVPIQRPACKSLLDLDPANVWPIHSSMYIWHNIAVYLLPCKELQHADLATSGSPRQSGTLTILQNWHFGKIV